MVADDHRGEEVLLDGAPRGLHRLPRKNLRDRIRVHRLVVAAAAGLGDAGHERAVGAGAQGHRRNGRPAVDQRLHQAVVVGGLGLPVAEHDQVLDPGRGAVEHLPRGVHPRVHEGPAAGADAVDGGLDPGPVAGGLERDGDEGLAVEADHAHLVLRAEQLDGGLGGLAGERDRQALHAPALVDDEHHRHRGLLLLLLEAAGQRQHLLDRRAVVAAEPEAVLAAKHRQPAAEVRDVAAEQRELRRREVRGRHVRDHHRVEGEQAGQVRRAALRRADLHGQVLLLHRVHEGRHRPRLLVQHQHAGPAGDVDGGGNRVVHGEAVGPLTGADLHL